MKGLCKQSLWLTLPRKTALLWLGVSWGVGRVHLKVRLDMMVRWQRWKVSHNLSNLWMVHISRFSFAIREYIVCFLSSKKFFWNFSSIHKYKGNNIMNAMCPSISFNNYERFDNLVSSIFLPLEYFKANSMHRNISPINTSEVSLNIWRLKKYSHSTIVTN